MDRPIRPFYCCYLLRSTVSPRMTPYVGSTPHPSRRLRQHNGVSKGGAYRTARRGGKGRPWEMACIVAGFPSKIAALQFEWAWQNCHESRHLSKSLRPLLFKTEAPGKAAVNTFPKRIACLWALLHSKSFIRWPLEIRFFANSAFKLWNSWEAGLPARELQRRTSRNIKVRFLGKPDELARKPDGKSATTPAVGKQQAAEEAESMVQEDSMAAWEVPPWIDSIDITYESLRSHLQKSQTFLKDRSVCSCGSCQQLIKRTETPTLICPSKGCNGAFHVSCLSNHFIHQEGRNDAMLPKRGACPQCKTPLEWETMVKELSLRMRGQKYIDALFKPPRKGAASAAAATSPLDELLSDSDGESDVDLSMVAEDEEQAGSVAAKPKAAHRKRGTSASETQKSAAASKTPKVGARGRKKVVQMGGSDWEGVDVLE